MTIAPTDASGRIFLTGFMASGKSTVGPLLAKELGYQFVDLDREIERSAGRRIGTIFREEGEDVFRRLERDHLQKVAHLDCVVIALGGGALMDKICRQMVAGNGTLIYIRVPVEVILSRLKGVRGRPVIAASDGTPLSGSALRARVRSLLREREGVYRTARLTVNAGRRDPDTIVREILKVIPH
ncbi:MAG TPA: shikimate kinase [Bacteroidota bacterium]|nr:shikimate kinase [Bacteroidota bacterium]